MERDHRKPNGEASGKKLAAQERIPRSDNRFAPQRWNRR